VVRLVGVALLSLFLAQESSLGSLFAGEECVETCPDDEPGGRCSPFCGACSCGTRLNPVPPRVAHLETPAPRDGFELATPVVVPAEVHPAEIAHVPIGASS
jgi:hypothetical protein